MLRKFSSLITIVLFLGIFAYSQTRPNDLSLGVVGVAVPEPGTLIVAVPIANLSSRAVVEIRIDRIELSNAKLRTRLPLNVKTIRGQASESVQAEFDSKSLAPGNQYDLVMQGTYRTGPATSATQPFRVGTSFVLPPLSPGSRDLRKTQVPGRKVKGGRYPPQPPRMDKDVNRAAPPVPRTGFVPGTPTPKSTDTKRAVVGDPPAITFSAINPVGINGAGLGCSGDPNAGCAEPSGASGNGVIFVSANWRVAYSLDGGGTFTVLDPTTIFPNDAVGYCCDQIIQYAPSIDRFIWLLQGNGVRLAVASPAQVKNSGGTAWTYWNLTPDVFGQQGASFDYPDLSVGNNFLYMS